MPAPSDRPFPPLPEADLQLLEQVRMQERLRLARELHDELGGNLTALKLGLAQLAAQLPPPLQPRAASLDDLLDRTFDAVHAVTGSLRASLPGNSLAAALRAQAELFEQHSGVAVHLACPDEGLPLDHDQGTALFAIAREALTNVARHAGASRVEIMLGASGGVLTLAIQDNGRGLPCAPDASGRHGIAGMRERASAIGAALALSSGPQGGTMVVVTLPLAGPPHGDAARAEEQETE